MVTVAVAGLQSAGRHEIYKTHCSVHLSFRAITNCSMYKNKKNVGKTILKN